MRKCLIALIFPLAVFALVAQERFESGKLKGFSIANPETEIVELEPAFVVRKVEGRVVDPTGAPAAGALFEIRNQKGKVIATNTDEDGNFRFRRIRAGKYDFKVTFSNFKSVIGVIEVNKNAKQPDVIQIEIYPGT